MHCFDCPVRQFTLYKAATLSDVGKLSGARKAELNLKKGQLILDDQRGATNVMVLQSGIAFAFALLNDGRRQILNFFHPGDLVVAPCVTGRAIHTGVRALSDVTLCQFVRDEFFKIIEDDHGLIAGAFAYLEEERQRFEEIIIGLGALNAEEAVASMILTFVRRGQKFGENGNRIKFPLRLNHVAEAVGITEIHAGRIMRSLEKRGMIKRESPDFLVVDTENLQQIVPCLGARIGA
jgi:CRP/FNR family transcriptional regulator